MRGRALLSFYCLLVYAFLLAPIVIVVLASFNAGAFLTFPPQGLSLRWYVTFFNNEVFMRAIRTSLFVAIIATFFSTVIGTAAAIYQVQYAGRLKEPIRVAMLTPLLLPEVLTAIALLFFVYAIGLRTHLAAKSVDAVIVTSRLRGLWPRYGERITAEAQRVGRRVLGASATSSP